MWFSIGFCFACAAGTYLFQWISWPLALALVFTGISLTVSTYWVRFLRIPAMLILSCAVGLCWFKGYDFLYLQSARNLDGCIESATIRISDYGEETTYGVSATGWIMVDGKAYQVMVYADGDDGLQPGQFVKGSFRFSFTAHGGSKEPSYRRSEGIFLTASLRGTYEIEDASPKWYDMPAVLRNGLSQRIEEIFPQSAAAFAKRCF